MPLCQHKWISTLDVDGGTPETPGMEVTQAGVVRTRAHCTLCPMRRIVERAPARPLVIETYRYSHADHAAYPARSA